MQLYPWLLALAVGIAGGPALADVLDAARTARQAAIAAEAPRLAAERWNRAEKDLEAAQRRLEQGDTPGAAKSGVEVEAAFRDAELQSLRSRYLSPVQSLLVTADEARAKRYAPATLASAREKLAVAEAALDANRADPDKAAASIEAARLEAAYAVRVAAVAKQIRRGDSGGEQAILSLEAVFAGIAAAAGLPPTPVVGDDVAAQSLVSGVRALRTRAERAERELAERDRQIASLEDELRELDLQLGGASAERDRLMMSMEAQRHSREQLAALQALFTPQEGTAFQQGNTVVLRITGLRFRPGSAQLSSSSLPLLDKLREAISLYPSAGITIEGHTDSSGSEATNQLLSEERAAAVATRLRSVSSVPTVQIQALGYGEERPVASNDTEAGRASNRRIDVIIRTGKPAGQN
ncbi:MAG: OmpA family protein [Gammaproteobacteria bacterium]|nr:OmpA family protein [Gammaproteobacteria bacterium]MDH5275126.1 OmpA family protein [Gammaproteobacteria bacterium]